MSGKAVRTKILDFLSNNSAETYIIDLTAEFDVLEDILSRYSVGRTDGWLGVTFLGDEETPRSINATNNTGCYREIGAVFLHIVERGSLSARSAIIDRADALQSLFRGRNIDGVKILTMTPPVFESGATLDFENGYISATINLGYEYDTNL